VAASKNLASLLSCNERQSQAPAAETDPVGGQANDVADDLSPDSATERVNRWFADNLFIYYVVVPEAHKPYIVQTKLIMSQISTYDND
jgi:uncharacterized protein YmfQ (DUF2313 family)